MSGEECILLASPADVIWGSSRVPAPLIGMRDKPLITSAVKALFWGIRKKSIWSSGLHSPLRNSVATSNVLHAGSPPLLWYSRKKRLVNCTDTSLYWWTVLLVLKILPIKLLLTANFLHRPPLHNSHVLLQRICILLTSGTVILLSPWWPLWKDLAVDAIFAIIISTRAV